MPSDNRSQRPSSSGWPGSAGSFSSRGSFRPRPRPNSSTDQAQSGQVPNFQSFGSGPYRSSNNRFQGNNWRDHYSSNRSRSGSYYSSRDSSTYNQDQSQVNPSSSSSAQTNSGSRYHPRNNSSSQSNPNSYQPRYTSRNDQRPGQRSWYNSNSYYGSGSRQNSMNTSTKEDFYDNSHSSYAPNNNFRDESNRRTSSYNSASLYPKRTDRSDDSYKFQRNTSRPSLIPKDFKDEYNDDDDEEVEKQSIKKEEEDTPERDEETTEQETTPMENPIPINEEPKTKLELKPEPQKELELEPQEPEPEVEDTDASEDSGKEDEKMEEEDKADVAITENEEVTQNNHIFDKESSAEKEEDSDSYDPEINITNDIKKAIQEVDISPKKTEKKFESLVDTIKQIVTDSPPISQNQTQNLAKPKKKQIIVPLKTPDADIFPLPKLEDKVWELKNHQRKDIVSELPYLLKKSIKSVDEYPFYSRNFLVHEQVIRPKLLKNLSIIKTNTFLTKASLVNEYQQRTIDWEDRLNIMNEQISALYPDKSKTQEAPEEEAQNEQPTNPESTRASTSRRGRGDAVQSEAEFLEILKSLGAEEEDEPLRRAEHLAAPIPDMILNPVSKNIFLTNINNLVTDKEEWSSSINVDGVDNFSRKEHELFCEAFLSYPKRFGRISAFMGGLRTPEECVLHYYRTKKTLTDYKQLLVLKKKRRKGPKGKRGPKPKSIANTPLDTPHESGDELSLDNLIPKEVTEEVYYTETGRRRRAAAPTFESTEPENGKVPVVEPTPVVVEQERKRSLETPTSVEQSTEESKETNQEISSASVVVAPAKKKQRGPKPKKQTEIPNSTVISGEILLDNPLSGADQKNKGNITSYWSVRDTNLFTSLLGKYGQNWMVIAEHIKTKSAVMVRNYYHRNAEEYGWKKIVETAEDRLKSENTEHIAPKNPPLGVFTASNNVPSNINVTYTAPPQQQAQAQPQTQPQQSNSPIPNLSSILPPAVQIHQTSQLPATATFLPSPVSAQNSSIPPPSGSKEPVSRSNPFSITSLLNPSSEERKLDQSPVKIPPPTPTTITNGSSHSYDPVRQVTSQLPPPVDTAKPIPGFNPLNTLLDAVEHSPGWNNQSSSIPVQQVQNIDSAGKMKFENVRSAYGRDTPNYTGGYQASYSESSLRGDRSILNNDNEGVAKDVKPVLPPLPSNFKSILTQDSGIPGHPNGDVDASKK